MMKSKNKQTPQEMYWEKKRREDEERDASLPPGLINHGNTCFMNSTLQGLIATRPLHDLVYFQSVPQSIQPIQGPSILSQRSPQLTNGHGLGGSSELARTEGMPLGDIFTTIMRKAWDIQDAKRRESMSPKEILTTIGRKYDQYLDFRQQDAHEFLRHMLDAMRMEELDIIKKRQPPPPKTKRRRTTRTPEPRMASSPLLSSSLPLPETLSLTPGSPSSSSDLRALPSESTSSDENQKLESFVDMLFGGQLASILVCEKCKKVSVTHEDFNDLSLSIKPEDYVKGRKRDRLKKIARKLRIRPPAAQDANGQQAGRGMFRGMQRASSMPASPVRRSTEVAPHEAELPTSVDPRRRSFDHPGEEEEARDVVKEMAGSASPGLTCVIAEDEQEHQPETKLADAAEANGNLENWTKVEADAGEAVDEKTKEKNGKEKEKDKDKDGDPWGKLARRISVSMKLTKNGDKDKDREGSRPSSRMSDRGRRTDIKDAIRVMRGGEPRSPRATSLAPGASAHDTPAETAPTEVPEALRAQTSSPIPPSPKLPTSLIQASQPSSSRRSSANPFKPHRHHHHHHHHDTPTQSKSPAAPRVSEEELAYLRRVLADVHPVTGNPLLLLQHAFTGGGGLGASGASAALATQTLWAKLGHLPGIEECLRMFTAVEILDGENMVGCHRCWKIANGTYRPNVRDNGEIIPEDDSDSESESEDSDGSDQSAAKAPGAVPPLSPSPISDADEGAAASSPDLSSGRASPASTSLVSTTFTQASSRPTDATSVSSAPSVPTPAHGRKDSVMSPVRPDTYGGLPIPQISTTEPDTPEGGLPAIPMTRGNINETWSSTRAVIGLSLSDDSLLTPKGRHRGRSKVKKDKDRDGTDSSTSSDDDFDDSGSDTSAATSLSEGSVSPSVSPRSSVERLEQSPSGSPKLGSDGDVSPQGVNAAEKIPRAKQVVLRRMYKRYLISTPPPILVIHLKRFQQTGKTHGVSLSGGFKKLDDFVAFPENLDLTPFLAPKREDFAHEKWHREKEKGQLKQPERCMYRLYAVVVHIGNMLGGHYVAYTALPTSDHSAKSETPASESEKTVPGTPSPPSHDSRTSQSSDGSRPVRQWAYISDTVVRLTTLEEVLKAKAYICMYERV